MVKYLDFHIGTMQFLMIKLIALLNQSIMLSNNNRDDFLTIANDYGNLSAAWIFRDSSNTQLYNIIDESIHNGSIINAEWNIDIPSTRCGQGLVSGPNAMCALMKINLMYYMTF